MRAGHVAGDCAVLLAAPKRQHCGRRLFTGPLGCVNTENTSRASPATRDASALNVLGAGVVVIVRRARRTFDFRHLFDWALRKLTCMGAGLPRSAFDCGESAPASTKRERSLITRMRPTLMTGLEVSALQGSKVGVDQHLPLDKDKTLNPARRRISSS